MKDFRLYDLTDFVMDEDFIRWVQKKFPADTLFWNNWLQQNPEKHLLIAEAKQIVECIRGPQDEVPPDQVGAEIDRLLQTIKIQGKNSLPARRVFSISVKWRLSIAAAVLLMVVAGIFRILPEKKKSPENIAVYNRQPSPSSLIEKINPSENTVNIPLPDGSKVELGARSRISFPKNFGDARDVYLSGQAYFIIARNPAKPFRVFANEVVTKVLGTSFTIRSYEKDTSIRITVRTGKISVYSQTALNDREIAAPHQSGEIIVTPNQELVYQRAGQKFRKMLIDRPLFIVPDSLDHSMNYEDIPVDQVLDRISKYYGINIVYDSDLVSKCTVTADLADEPFYRKLDLICQAIGAKYELMDGQVVIQTNGCQ